MLRYFLFKRFPFPSLHLDPRGERSRIESRDTLADTRQPLETITLTQSTQTSTDPRPTLPTQRLYRSILE